MPKFKKKAVPVEEHVMTEAEMEGELSGKGPSFGDSTKGTPERQKAWEIVKQGFKR